MTAAGCPSAARYEKLRRHAIHNGTWRHRINAAPSIELAREYLASGWTERQIEHTAGLHKNYINRLLGLDTAVPAPLTLLPDTADAIASVASADRYGPRIPDVTLVNTIGSIRRVQRGPRGTAPGPVRADVGPAGAGDPRPVRGVVGCPGPVAGGCREGVAVRLCTGYGLGTPAHRRSTLSAGPRGADRSDRGDRRERRVAARRPRPVVGGRCRAGGCPREHPAHVPLPGSRTRRGAGRLLTAPRRR